ncbi:MULTISPECIES: TlpA family protein disulfide reductase [Lysinibacillus]|uniref:TlpA family protein disulfide reductase n=1 Tax=Lysinibacillus TaxID=400634 RepID=UPI002580921B|nr:MULTISPECIES: TlpA disulfide reductase family protein [Lysinibacillus]
MKRKKLIGLVVSLTVVVFLIGIALKDEVFKEELKPSMIELANGSKKIVYDTKLMNFDKTLTTFEKYKGKVLIVNFWASWCGPCQDEVPDLKAFYNQKGDNVELLAINATANDSYNNVLKFLENYKLNFPIFLDGDGTLQKSFEVINYPTTFIFDAEGALKYTIKGQINQQELKKIISEI